MHNTIDVRAYGSKYCLKKKFFFLAKIFFKKAHIFSKEEESGFIIESMAIF